MRHFIIVGILVLLVAVLTYLGLDHDESDASCRQRTGRTD